MYFVTPTLSTPIGMRQKSATQCIGGVCWRESRLVLKRRMEGVLERSAVGSSMKVGENKGRSRISTQCVRDS